MSSNDAITVNSCSGCGQFKSSVHISVLSMLQCISAPSLRNPHLVRPSPSVSREMSFLCALSPSSTIAPKGAHVCTSKSSASHSRCRGYQELPANAGETARAVPMSNTILSSIASLIETETIDARDGYNTTRHTSAGVGVSTFQCCRRPWVASLECSNLEKLARHSK